MAVPSHITDWSMRFARLSKYAQDTAHAAVLTVIIIILFWLIAAYFARQWWRAVRDAG